MELDAKAQANSSVVVRKQSGWLVSEKLTAWQKC